MIVKVARGTRMSGLVYYLLGEGRHEEHDRQRVIATSAGIGVPLGRELSPVEARELAVQLNTPIALYDVQIARGHVWHLSLSNRNDDRELSDEQWADAVRHVMAKVGFDDPDKAAAPWAAFHHGRSENGNDHVHVAVCLVREDGTKAGTHNDYKRVAEAARELEERYGLIVVGGRHAQTATRWPGRAEWEITERREHVEDLEGGDGEQTDAGEPAARTLVDREDLAVIVRGVAVGSRDEAEFVRRLWDAGIETRPRMAAGAASEVAGYAVRPIDTERWWAGGKLAKDLALPRLRGQWEPVADQVTAWQQPDRPAGVLKDRDVDDVTGEDRAGLEGREWEAVPAGQWERSARWARSAAADVAAGRVEPGPVAGRAAGLAGALSTRVEPAQRKRLRYLAHELSRYPQARRTEAGGDGSRRTGGGGDGSPRAGAGGEGSRGTGAGRDGSSPLAALATAATVALQASRIGQTAAVMALVVELVRLAETLAQLNETHHQLEYARALRRSTEPVAAGVAAPDGGGEQRTTEAEPGPPAPTPAPAEAAVRLDPMRRAQPRREHDRGFER